MRLFELYESDLYGNLSPKDRALLEDIPDNPIADIDYFSEPFDESEPEEEGEYPDYDESPADPETELTSASQTKEAHSKINSREALKQLLAEKHQARQQRALAFQRRAEEMNKDVFG